VALAVNLPNLLGRIWDPADVDAAWPDESRVRLLHLKDTWDPANLFRLGHALRRAPASR